MITHFVSLDTLQSNASSNPPILQYTFIIHQQNMSFGQWYEEQKNPKTERDEESSFLPLFLSSSGASNHILPLDLNWSSFRTNLESQMPQSILGMNYQQRFKVFCGLLLLSGVFFALAFFVGLPMIGVRPQKFALSFTFGSLTFMGSFAILRGPEAHFGSMLQTDRLPFTAVYGVSMFMTLYCTFQTHGPKAYLLVLLCSVLQILALLWYLITFLPGGSQGLTFLLQAILTILRPVRIACTKCFGACVRGIMGGSLSSSS